MLEDDYDDALLIQDALDQTSEYEFTVTQVDHVRKAIDRLAKNRYHAILVDMFFCQTVAAWMSSKP